MNNNNNNDYDADKEELRDVYKKDICLLSLSLYIIIMKFIYLVCNLTNSINWNISRKKCFIPHPLHTQSLTMTKSRYYLMKIRHVRLFLHTIEWI